MTAPLIVVLSLVGTLVALPTTTASAAAVPATPAGLPAAVEARQPYVGQSVCDPVAKPGVRAFASLVLNTYRSTSSLGIVRDCGVGAQSEHKEGRGWDWGGVSTSDPARRADAQALLGWLTATDSRGNAAAMARRLGVMYMIYNRQIWKAYDSRGWQPYSGPSPHTDHVHFSFGWNGAKQVTSFWDKTVAPVDYGPRGAPAPAPVPVSVVPVRSPANLAIVRAYGSTVLTSGSTGNAVVMVQRALKITADGSYGPQTAGAVSTFQRSLGLPATGQVGTVEWQRLYPPPIDPFGSFDAARVDAQTVHVAGWTIDADSTAPLKVAVTVAGAANSTVVADLARSDVAGNYPGYGDDVGFRTNITVPEGTSQICAVALNAAGSPGANTSLGCKSVTVAHSPYGELDGPVVQQPGSTTTTVRGFAVDPNTSTPIRVHVRADGAGVAAVTAAAVGSKAPGGGNGFTASPVLAEGNRSVCTYAINATGTPGRNTTLGCSTVRVRHSPFGAVEQVAVVPGGVKVAGWAIDYDVTTPVSLRVTVAGQPTRTLTASAARTDVAAANPGFGSDLGFGTQLTLPEGRHDVCVTAVNVGGSPGADTALGCRSVVVSNTPTGLVDPIVTTPDALTTPGRTAVTGWALDPDVAGAVKVHAYVDGRLVTGVTANRTDGRTTSRFPLNGGSHGYRVELDLAEGTRSVCLYALNAAGTPGKNVKLGCQTVVVKHAPVGHLDGVTAPAAGTVRVKGWTLDPDTAAPLRVHVYVDGVARTAVTASGSRSDIGRLYPAYGPAHGYTAQLSVAPGAHTVCTYAMNAAATPGRTVRLGCAPVTVP